MSATRWIDANAAALGGGGRAFVLSCVLAAACGGAPGDPTREPPLNVLFFSVDDLGVDLGCYGSRGARTPRIDQLAAEGVTFTRAYCQQAVCGPSRASMLTGCRPDTTGVVTLKGDFRDALPEHVTLPEHFKRHGWTTYALGKVHHGHGELDDARSWSKPCWRPPLWQRSYVLPENRALVERRAAEEADDPYYIPRVVLSESAPAEDSAYPDGLIADEAIRFLREEGDEPFFLVVGFLKPHVPFIAPERYWDLHPLEEQELPSREAPAGAPAFARHASPELRSYEDIPDRRDFTPEEQRSFLRGYRACASFVDAQIGRVLDALEEQGLAERTVVVVWGDHGWHLGDLGMWGKHTNYESATHAPLILRVPSGQGAGARSAALVEFVDLYPSLAELCRLPAPSGVEGTSLAPLLSDPDRRWKSAAFSQFPRPVPGKGLATGHSLRTDRYRLVEWSVPGQEQRILELYDYDAGPFEQRNLAADPEYAELRESLLQELHAGWEAAVPQVRAPDGE